MPTTESPVTFDTSALQLGPGAPRGARNVLSRFIKGGARVPLFFGQTAPMRVQIFLPSLSCARSQGSNPWQTQIMALGVSHPLSIFLWRWSRISGIPCLSV